MAEKVEALTLTESIRVNGVPTKACLAADGTLQWRGGDGGERCLAVESDVLGFAAEGLRITLRAFAGAFEGVSGGGRSFGKETRRDYVLELPTEDAGIQWSERLRDCINSLGRPKRLLIILNPFGGKKCGREIFHNEVKPLLVAADITYTMEETKYQLHAQEIAYSLDLQKYDGIVCVSGDGILVEVVNGLLKREDWETAIKMPLGIIPAGTGNGMAKSLLDSVGDLYSVSSATFAVIRGHKRPLDVTTVLQGATKFFSVLLLTWGFVADVDIESEKFRWLGRARLDFYLLLRLMNLRRYHGSVQFVPAPEYESYGEPITQDSSCLGTTVPAEQDQVNNANVKSCGYPGPVASLDGLEWRSIDGPFVSVLINNVPWASEGAMPAPEAKFSDGCLDAVIIRDCPKLALLSLLLKMSDGSHLKSPYVTYLKVRAFRLEPGQRVGDPGRGGIIDCDGEAIARGDEVNANNQQGYLMSYGPPIRMTIDQGLATIFSP